MPNPLCESLIENFQNAITLVSQAIGQFDQEEWRKGEHSFEVPCRIGYHIVDCLDYYFREDLAQAYQWGHRFEGGPPTQEALLGYLGEVGERIGQHLSSLSAGDLSSPYDKHETRLGRYVYALRHTMHHHGVLSLLALSLGHAESGWL